MECLPGACIPWVIPVGAGIVWTAIVPDEP